MMPLPDFRGFFHALWRYHSLHWQAMLAERVAQGPWPQAMDLPTAAAEAACIDAAIRTLASQADRWLVERTAPRRAWFVVDRRIFVDEAHEGARTLANKPAGVMDERGSGLDPAHREGGLCWSPGSLCEAPQAFRVSSQGLWIEIEDDIVEHAVR
jgi:CRISPR-associated endonuclease/helicase Cas3